MKADFRIRKKEVVRYFKFVEKIARGTHKVLVARDSDIAYDQAELNDIIKTLKASAFLLLYNLLESTLKNAVEAIFDELQSQSVEFDSCRDELRMVILSNLKHRNVDELLPLINQLAIDVIATSFAKERLFSGNVDGRTIRNTAKEYGFSAPRKKSDELLTVKTNRNDLAHGNKTFSEVGRDYDVKRLKSIVTEVVAYLTELIDNVELYLNQGHYLHTNGRSVQGSDSSSP